MSVAKGCVGSGLVPNDGLSLPSIRLNARSEGVKQHVTDQTRHYACDHCGEPFTGRSIARFCSDRCRGQAWQAQNREAVRRAKQAGLV